MNKRRRSGPTLILLLLSVVFMMSCGSFFAPEKWAAETESSPHPQTADTLGVFTSSPPSLTLTSTSSQSEEPTPNSTTPITDYPSQCPKTSITQKDAGLVIQGFVYLPGGRGLAGIKIFRAYASYDGQVIATTDADGCYHSDFFPIPGDEMVRVWAELPGYSFEMANSQLSWDSSVYSWRHYHGFEHTTLNFIAHKQ